MSEENASANVVPNMSAIFFCPACVSCWLSCVMAGTWDTMLFLWPYVARPAYCWPQGITDWHRDHHINCIMNSRSHENTCSMFYIMCKGDVDLVAWWPINKDVAFWFQSHPRSAGLYSSGKYYTTITSWSQRALEVLKHCRRSQKHSFIVKYEAWFRKHCWNLDGQKFFNKLYNL